MSFKVLSALLRALGRAAGMAGPPVGCWSLARSCKLVKRWMRAVFGLECYRFWGITRLKRSWNMPTAVGMLKRDKLPSPPPFVEKIISPNHIFVRAFVLPTDDPRSGAKHV